MYAAQGGFAVLTTVKLRTLQTSLVGSQKSKNTDK